VVPEEPFHLRCQKTGSSKTVPSIDGGDEEISHKSFKLSRKNSSGSLSSVSEESFDIKEAEKVEVM